MKFTRYEIQAFTLTEMSYEDADGEHDEKYGWIPIPARMMFPVEHERKDFDKFRGDDGRWGDLLHASEAYRMLREKRPAAVLRLRKIVIQEVYTTLDGTDSDDEDRVRTDARARQELMAELWPSPIPVPMV